MSLADKQCPACHGGVPALDTKQTREFLTQLNGWDINSAGHLQKSIKTKNFSESLALANRFGAIAEEQNHHPDLLVRWGELRVELFTHAINGLSEADFILAA